MLKVLVCACLLAVRINASGSNEQLHQPSSSLALPSGQLDAIPEPGGEEDELPKPSDRMVHPQRSTGRNNTSSRVGPSTFTNRKMKWAPKHRELPTRVPSPLPPKKHNSSRTREPRDTRNDRGYERRSPSNRRRSSRHHRGMSSPVTRVSIELPSKSHYRDRHSSRKHSHRSCTIHIQEEDGHISVRIHDNSPRGSGSDSDAFRRDRRPSSPMSRRRRSPRHNDSPFVRDDYPRSRNRFSFDRNSPRVWYNEHSPRGSDSSRRRDSDSSRRGRGRSPPIESDHPLTGRNRSPVGLDNHAGGSYLSRSPSPVLPRRDRSPRLVHSPRRDYSPIDHGDNSESRVGRRSSPVRPQRLHSPRRDYEPKPPQPDTLSPADISRIHDVIDRVDFETFGDICWDNRRLGEEGLIYMVETKSSAFIINVIKNAAYVRLRTLPVLLSKRSKATIEEVLKEVTVSQDDLVYAAQHIDLASSPERFVDLISRIETPDDQQEAIMYGIWELLEKKRTDCIDPLLIALEDSKFFNRDVKDSAVQVVFRAGVFYGNEVWTKSFYNHPLITSEIYTYGLICAGRSDVNNPIFKWLLATASREDLLAVKKQENYGGLGKDFVNAIEQAISSAKPGKVRLGVTGPKVEAVKRIFRDGIGCTLVPEAVVGIIGSYMIEDYEYVKIEQRSDSGEESAPEGTSKRMPAEQEGRQAPEIGQGQEREQTRGRRQIQELENVTQAQEVEQMPQEVEQVTTRTEKPERVAKEPAQEIAQAQEVEEGLTLVQGQEAAPQSQDVGQGPAVSQPIMPQTRMAERASRRRGRGRGRGGKKTRTKSKSKTRAKKEK